MRNSNPTLGNSNSISGTGSSAKSIHAEDEAIMSPIYSGTGSSLVDEENNNNNTQGYMENNPSVVAGGGGAGGGQYYYGGNGGGPATPGDNQSYYRPSSGMGGGGGNAVKGRSTNQNSNKWPCGVKESSGSTGSMSPSSSNNSNTPPSSGLVPNSEFSFPPTTTTSSSFMDNFYHHAHYFPYHHHHHHHHAQGGGFLGQGGESGGPQISNGDLPMDQTDFYHQQQQQQQQQQHLQQHLTSPLFPSETPFLANPTSYYTNLWEEKKESEVGVGGEKATLAKGGRKNVGNKFLSSCKEEVESKKMLLDEGETDDGNELKTDIVKLEKIARRSQPC